MIPYLQTARDAVTDINSNTQALSNTMEDMQDELDRLYDRLGSLSKSLRSASDELNKGLVSQQTQDAIEKDIVQRTAEVQKILEELDKTSGTGKYLPGGDRTGDWKPESEFSHVRRHEAETDPQDEECGEGRDICIVGGGIWKRKWSDSGGGWQRRYHGSAGAADHAKTTGSANTTDDAEMAAGTESKDSAEQEAAGAGIASGAAGNQAEKAAESATKTEEKNPASTADKAETDSAKNSGSLRKTTPRVRMQR